MVFKAIGNYRNVIGSIVYASHTGNSTENPRYNGQNPAVHNCEFLEMLRHYDGFVVRKLFKTKKNPNIKPLM
jgi:hypothetical protein